MLRQILKSSQGLYSKNILAQSQPLMALNRRFEGAYPWYQSMADDIPKKNYKIADDQLDETEIITRIMWILHNFHIYDISKFNWSKPFDQQGIDSLEATALLTSIEHEFHTIFEDRVFENFDNMNQVKEFLSLDHNAF